MMLSQHMRVWLAPSLFACFAATSYAQSDAVELPPVHATGNADSGYTVPETRSGTRTPTALRDVPQSMSVVTQQQIRDQSMQNLGDVARYVPGVGTAQGEGNRETLILRGVSTTSDFYIDGVRDDVQYYRDLYNIDRVEILRGPNAMLFGRGATGGAINRVLKHADWDSLREVNVQLGSFDNRRATLDINESLNDKIAARVAAVYEDSDSYRDGVFLKRQGINPTLALRTGEATTLTLGYEYFQDERTADRGIPSLNGAPVPTASGTFFGDPQRSPTDTELNTVSAVLEHAIGDGLSLRNSSRYGHYNKFYQNVFPGAVSFDNTDNRYEVAISAYSNATQRDNLFNQTDLVAKLNTGAIAHTVLAGVELGRQVTTNLRLTGFFADGPDVNNSNPNSSVYNAPLSAPTIDETLTFRANSTDANNDGVTRIVGVYVQDQVQLSPAWQAVLGLRYDRVEVNFRDLRNGGVVALSTTDQPLSPRAGLIYKPLDVLSLYASYSRAYQPRAGEQLASLTPSTQALDPEEFVNYEVGAKWDVRPGLALTAAAYQLDRSNVAITDPNDATRMILVDGQRLRGIELGWTGRVTAAWSIAGGYARQDGEISSDQSASIRKGAQLAQVPVNSFSLWNRYDFDRVWGAGLGVINRSKMLASTENLATPSGNVVLGGYTRVDAALYFAPSSTLSAQLNVENLLDEDYALNAHNNNNITPGSPLALRASMTLHF